MSRLGFINKKFADAQETGETPDLNDADLWWCAEWERWDLVAAAGYDPDELREQYNLSKETGADPFNTSGVPRVGSDRLVGLGAKRRAESGSCSPTRTPGTRRSRSGRPSGRRSPSGPTC